MTENTPQQRAQHLLWLWWNNDQGLYNDWRERVADVLNSDTDSPLYQLEHSLLDLYEEHAGLEDMPAGIVSDMLGLIRSVIDWRDVASTALRHYFEDPTTGSFEDFKPSAYNGREAAEAGTCPRCHEGDDCGTVGATPDRTDSNIADLFVCHTCELELDVSPPIDWDGQPNEGEDYADAAPFIVTANLLDRAALLLDQAAEEIVQRSHTDENIARAEEHGRLAQQLRNLDRPDRG